jgi:glucose/arabinose dehydrogenase
MGNEARAGKNRSQKIKRSIGCIAVLAVIWFGCNAPVEKNNGSHGENNTGRRWRAPEEANKLKNPFPNNVAAEQAGKELYDLYCWSCHGQNGFGDGAAGNALGQQPANFHDRRVKSQTDGALFWKLTNGRGNMPPFKEALSDQQRWQLISYIRKFTVREPVLQPPTAFRKDIKVEHYMFVDSLAVRILQHPVTQDLYYTTFDGNVIQVKKAGTKPVSRKILSLQDHGISRLQGAVFSNDKLFLCGNVDLNDKKGTSGRMVRFTIDTSGASDMVVVFNTASYGSNRTIYDHGWNALELSADNKFIYVNSGARTDHGEIQDNGGLYPNARDNALTSKIFRFPIDARDLMLPDDEQILKANGYTFAEGVRNAYDMSVDGSGNLFAVSNSSDYDNPEDMFWVREGRHYGFPWVMGGIENPQQYPDWKPDPDTDPFINRFSHSWQVRYFANDTTFPKIPAGLKFTPAVQNLGPDANEYRGHSGHVLDGDITGIPVSTFTPHCSPLGLFFDKKKVLGSDLKGDGFVIRYTSGRRGSMMRAFTREGSDLLHLEMTYDETTDNYFVRTRRIVEGFNEPVDAIMINNEVFVIEYGGERGNIWKITLPGAKSSNSNSEK